MYTHRYTTHPFVILKNLPTQGAKKQSLTSDYFKRGQMKHMVLNVVFKKKSQSPNGFMFNLVSLKTGTFVSPACNL